MRRHDRSAFRRKMQGGVPHARGPRPVESAKLSSDRSLPQPGFHFLASDGTALTSCIHRREGKFFFGSIHDVANFESSRERKANAVVSSRNDNCHKENANHKRYRLRSPAHTTPLQSVM